VGQVVGRLFQATLSAIASTLTAELLGSLLSRLSSSPHAWVVGGRITGALLGVYFFSYAVAVPVGIGPFFIWYVGGVLLFQCLIAVPLASYLALTRAGLNPVAAALLSLFVVMPTFWALLRALIPENSLAPRVLHGKPLSGFSDLRRQADSLLARSRRRARAAKVWRSVLRRLG
jgi:hypothetical protein